MIRVDLKDHALYREALHHYLIHAYPDDDEMYYSRWVWLVPNLKYPFWKRKTPEDGLMPIQTRFGCHVSGDTKMWVWESGFEFDINSGTDSPEVIAETSRIRDLVHGAWRKHGIPVHEDAEELKCYKCGKPRKRSSGYCDKCLEIKKK